MHASLAKFWNHSLTCVKWQVQSLFWKQTLERGNVKLASLMSHKESSSLHYLLSFSHSEIGIQIAAEKQELKNSTEFRAVFKNNKEQV